MLLGRQLEETKSSLYISDHYGALPQKIYGGGKISTSLLTYFFLLMFIMKPSVHQNSLMKNRLASILSSFFYILLNAANKEVHYHTSI